MMMKIVAVKFLGSGHVSGFNLSLLVSFQVMDTHANSPFPKGNSVRAVGA